jgi:hypothetical protein
METIWDLHEPAAASSRPECPSQALNSNDHEPSPTDRNQTFSAKRHPLLAGGPLPLHI